MFVWGFAPFNEGEAVTIVPDELITQIKESGRVGEAFSVVLQETSKPAGLILFLSGIVALGYLAVQTVKLDQIARDRMYVVFILTFFSMLFWAFFEQAGSSVNNFTDRNVDRAFGGSARAVLLSLFDCAKIDGDELQELRRLINRKAQETNE